MVAPHQVGDLVRSFVRVPGSGSEKSAKPAFCDLARASTLAATVSVPQNLPPATNVLTLLPTANSITNNQQRKRPKSEENESSESIKASKAKVNHIVSPPAAIPVKNIPITLMVVRIPNAEVQKLKEENVQLRKENEILKKQLSLFKQLIRNPQRLNSVLSRLEEKAQEV
ncbi:unnamed protein product [Meganyctiphanes norvegica]|uniref:Uncharacterized protein n=1 Tax=Meganyctiphanes norvegica TaxID=48144 RepID=A0AAV2SE14_MEGNR